MRDLILSYRECGAECREDWLRILACDNGLPLAEVQRAADRLGEREDFGRLMDFCEGYGGRGCFRAVPTSQPMKLHDDFRPQSFL